MSSTRSLLIDVGNTSIKLVLRTTEGLRPVFELPTDKTDTPDSLGLKILEYLRLENVAADQVKTWVMASVVPMLNERIALCGKKFCLADIYQVPENLSVGINNKYQSPHEVGADRLITAYGARRTNSHQGLLVIDFGTATTFDCVIENDYIGGLICPGVFSSIQALGSKTAKLPWFSLEEAGKELEIGRSTSKSLAQGTLFGFAAMVEGLVARLKKHMPGQTRILATGGAGEILAGVCPSIEEVQPALLMQGLVFTGMDHKIF